ncbi:MAG TPA: sugar phosphate isomerase/epimerase [Tepidisphaeraceae bacterium]|jgi:sugar phosphate isomerase/epimerase|nr:sugar phosphate isomerase/epimerase [Tepidisphaeraceae bacterium]
MAALCVVLLLATASPRARAADATTRPVIHVNHAALLKLSWQLAGRCATFHDRSALETIDLLHSLNFHHLELAPDEAQSPDDVDALLSKLKHVHMDIVSFGVVRPDDNESDVRKIFDLAKTLRAKTIVVDPPDDSLELLDKLAGEYRINVAIVNFPKPANHWNPDEELRLLSGRSGRMGICADIVAWQSSGLSPVQCVRKLAGHILEVHLSDVDDQGRETTLGAGVVDVSGIASELKTQGFKGICAIGYATGSGQDLIDHFTLSVNAFSDILGELSRAR